MADHDMTDDELLALAAMKVVTGLVARHYGVCPLCLTYNFANLIEDAEDQNLIQHWGDHGDPVEPERTPEEKEKADTAAKRLGELLRAFQADGTKH